MMGGVSVSPTSVTAPMSNAAPVRAFDPAAHIINGITSVPRCIDWLTHEGFVPISAGVGVNLAHPLIVIEVCARCEWLKSACSAYPVESEPDSSGGYGKAWRAEMFGCLIQWVERGH